MVIFPVLKMIFNTFKLLKMVTEGPEVHNLKQIFSIKEITFVYVFSNYIISGLDSLIENYMRKLYY